MSEIELIWRLGTSLLFGLIVGVERQWHHKNAGIKTNTLVAIGSTAFAIISEYGFGPTNNPAAVAAGVVTGIGFIGAGVILRRGGSVQGINSAATLWATASMGLAIGQGYYRLAPLMLAAILIIQFPMFWVARFIDKRSGLISTQVMYHLDVLFTPSAGETVRSIWASFAKLTGVQVITFGEAQSGAGETTLEASFGLSELRAKEMADLGQRLAQVPGVVNARWSQRTISTDTDS